MHSSVLTLGLFAVAALTSPLVNDKGDPDPIYVTKVITNSWVTTVAAAPAAWIPSEEETHRRHRHTGRAGSRLPAKYEYGYSLPTLESLPAITGLADISDTATLGADLSPTPKASGVSIQTNAPTETLRFEAPVVVPTLNVDKVETSTCESAVVKLSNTEAPTVTVLKTEPAPELEKVETSTVESFSVKNFESVPAPVDIPDFKTHTDPFPPVQYVPFLDPTSPTYKALVLQHHNIHRQNHSAVDLVWNDTMAKYAETTAKTCVWEHNLSPGGGGYGQNIASGAKAGNISAVLTNLFYNDEMPKYEQYNTNTPDLTEFEAWGHFTQLVWKKTLSVGCYTEICSPPVADPLDCKADGTSWLKKVKCGKGGTPAIFTVCDYYPQGNNPGQFLNVGAPLGEGRVYVNEYGVQGLPE